MRFDLIFNGKVYNVELDIGKLITIEIDGITFQAKTKKTDTGLYVQLDKKEFLVRFEGAYISIDGQKHIVEIQNLRRGRPSWNNATEATEDSRTRAPRPRGPTPRSNSQGGAWPLRQGRSTVQLHHRSRRSSLRGEW